MNIFEISKEEDGMKLLRFLERRTKAGRNIIYKWIRTGQVRVNGGRCKADRILAAGETVRIPPFASVDKSEEKVDKNKYDILISNKCKYSYEQDIVYEDDSIIVINKRAGLTVQSGSGHLDSVCTRLAQSYAHKDFVPAPAHRLDKDSTGLLVIGKTHMILRQLSQLFANDKAGLERDYFAWVSGDWPFSEPLELCDYISRITDKHDYERMAVVDGSYKDAKEARGVYELVRKLEVGGFGLCSLLKVRLLSGRKHQIRLQTSSRGYPIIGDTRYAGMKYDKMLLHAAHLVIPDLGRQGEKFQFELYPDWPEPFAVE